MTRRKRSRLLGAESNEVVGIYEADQLIDQVARDIRHFGEDYGIETRNAQRLAPRLIGAALNTSINACMNWATASSDVIDDGLMTKLIPWYLSSFDNVRDLIAKDVIKLRETTEISIESVEHDLAKYCDDIRIITALTEIYLSVREHSRAASYRGGETKEADVHYYIYFDPTPYLEEHIQLITRGMLSEAFYSCVLDPLLLETKDYLLDTLGQSDKMYEIEGMHTTYLIRDTGGYRDALRQIKLSQQCHDSFTSSRFKI